ncbi:unnamed protein product, partial [Prorocentrum cordatum]
RIPQRRRLPSRSCQSAEGLGEPPLFQLAILRETRLGALNRLKAARSTAAGAAADFCIAFEGGVEADDTGRLVCFAVVCAQYRSPRSKRILRGPRDSMSRLVEHGVPGSLFQNQLLVPSVF